MLPKGGNAPGVGRRCRGRLPCPPVSTEVLDSTREELAALGGRLAGTAQEREAIGRLAKRLERAGLTPRVEGFVESTSPVLTFAVHLAVAALALGLGTALPGVATFLWALVAVSAARELVRQPVLRRLLPRGISYNLVVERPAQRALGRLVLSAHIDQARRGLRPSRRGARIASAVFGAYALVLLGGVFGVGGALATWALVGGAFVLGLAALVVALSDRNRARALRGTGTSSIEAVLEALTQLEAEPLQHLDLVVVLSGCGEAHGGGVRALVRQHRHHWATEDTYLLFADDVGIGRLAYGTGESIVLPVAYRPTLPALAERLGRTRDHAGLEGRVLERYTDALVCTHAGYRAMTITGVEPEPGESDDPGRVRDAGRLLVDLARALDRDLGVP